MKWIKIEDGCEMPNNYDSVAISVDGTWDRGFLTTTGLWFSDGNYVTSPSVVTHWARVELPEE